MKRNLGIVAAVAVIAVLGLWGWSAYQKHQTRSSIVALTADAAARLKSALSREVPADFESAAQGAEKDAAALRKLDTAAMLPLADAADGYLVSVREIVRRRAAMSDAGGRQAKDLEALTQHVQSDRGRADWPQEAVRLRESLDRSFREYRIATESYAALLETLPGAQAKLAAQVKSLPVIDEKSIQDARAAALDALARADQNIRKVTQLDAYRGMRRQKGSR